MLNEKKQLFENFISLGALQAVSYIIPLLTLPYLARVLGTEYFGVVFFAQATMEYFIILTDYGFGLSAVREIAINRHNKNNLSNIFSSVMAIKFLLLLLSFLILLILIVFIPKLNTYKAVFLLSFLIVVGNAIYPVWFFQGMERMKYMTFLNILAKTIFLILIFVFIKQPTDYVIVPLLNSLGFITSGIIGLIFAIKKFNIKLYMPKINTIKKQFKYSSEFFLSRVSVAINTNTNTFFLGLISSNLMVGYYVAAEKIYRAFNGLSMPINSALYPFVSKYKNIQLFKKIYFIVVALNSIICILGFIFAKDIITIFYGAEMLEAYKVFRILCFTTFIAVPHILLGYPLLGAMGYTKEANMSVMIPSITQICGLLILFFTNNFTIYSLAYLVFFTEFTAFILRVYWVLKYKILKGENKL